MKLYARKRPAKYLGRLVRAPDGRVSRVAHVVRHIVVLEDGRAYHTSRIYLLEEE